LLDVASDMMTRTLDRRGGEAEGVRVSHCLIAAGPAAERLASADVIPVTDDPGLALGIAFGERGIETSDPVAYMTGQLWAWLSQAKEGLLPSCLPAALVQGLEIARTRAVTSGDYARAPDTELLIEGEDGRRWRMQRRRGRVRVIEQEAGEDGI
jgi:hypothetical protein